mmetsp:Transcript_11747/g.13605  ORF Transcript_11747/g.13605 Transcript_11747/m.13605 type:complete len:498 (-) Transcript_11747:1489-2982(-)|eukprot:CAMPEP_0204841326 /NCGR_PEP_ID=MMETSP1346-20131115/41390_1 /ASSEMBLY_ACC=CAM_ASM_000771 /TAXON_ID=215587 /ORGANISM="Aplanochytrium stocchinoi, Strain GSBS06" /LENGTH=497 /DNA_ID=CAMNT_0051979361 /DNA_START=113 /DNA_END=1606 /DNA_ORIENTATION=+
MVLVRRWLLGFLILQAVKVCKANENEHEKEPTRMSYFKISEEEQPFMARIDRLASSLKEETYKGSVPFELKLTFDFVEEYKKTLNKTEMTAREFKVIQAMVQKYQILKRRQRTLDNREPAKRRESCYDKLRLPISLVSVNYTDVYITGLPSNQDRRKPFVDLFGRKVKYSFWDAVSKYDVEIPSADDPEGDIKLKPNASFSPFIKESAEALSVARGWKLGASDPAVKIVPGLLYESQIPFFRNKKFWMRDMYDIEITTALTHWSLWNEIVSKDSKYAFIFDDGVSIDSRGFCDVGHAVKYLENNLKIEWDILYLDIEIFLGDNIEDTLLINNLGLDWTKVDFVYGSYAYAVSARGVKKLIAGGLERCIVPIDEYLAYMINADAHPRKQYIEEHCGFIKPEVFLALRWRGTKPVYKHINLLDDYKSNSENEDPNASDAKIKVTNEALNTELSQSKNSKESSVSDEKATITNEEGRIDNQANGMESTSSDEDVHIEKEL